MRIHALYHVPFEGPGIIEDWVRQKKHRFAETFIYKNESVPVADDFDLLVIMGGPMSVIDEDVYHWLKDEKELIRKACLHHKAVLGICLGAQMIAHALSSKVYANKYKEIGWFPVTFYKNSIDARLAALLPNELTVFHWHGETFDLPRDAILLAGSEATPNQGFILDNSIIGLQFHLEMKKENIESICHSCAEELIPTQFIQDRQTILQPMNFEKANHALMFSILDYLEQSIHLK